MLATVTALALIVHADPPKRQEPPSKGELAAITERGRNLAGYDAAAWHASDALQAKDPKLGGVGRYIARKTDQGWVVAFGRLYGEQDRFLIAYEAVQGKDPEHFDIKPFDPPKEDTGFVRSAARAIDTALKDFVKDYKGEKRPYNVAVLPAEQGRAFVYLVPAPTKPGVWPIGGDVRYLMEADGAEIHEKRRLHESIIELPAPEAKDGNVLAMGIHTHVLDDTPEDTDVFHVLTRKPAAPEMVTTPQFVFQVEPDGAITYVGKADEVLKK